MLSQTHQLITGIQKFVKHASFCYRRPIQQQAVKGGDTIDLGGGHILEFVLAPNLHWPDTMFSHDRATGMMYTCDAFGMHYCSEEPFDTDLKAVLPHYRYDHN